MDGEFDFNIGVPTIGVTPGAALGLTASDFVTVTANYFDIPLTGTAVGATGVSPHTSNFSHPLGIIILSTTLSGGGTTLNICWSGNYPSYSLQRSCPGFPISWTTIATGLSGPCTTTPLNGSDCVYRIVSP